MVWGINWYRHEANCIVISTFVACASTWAWLMAWPWPWHGISIPNGHSTCCNQTQCVRKLILGPQYSPVQEAMKNWPNRYLAIARQNCYGQGYTGQSLVTALVVWPLTTNANQMDTALYWWQVSQILQYCISRDFFTQPFFPFGANFIHLGECLN